MKKAKTYPEEIYERQAEICAALANPLRLMILDLLTDRESTAKELQERLGIPKSNLSQHLTVLKRAGILKTRNEGLFQHLSLSLPEVREACALVRKVLLRQMSQQAELAKSLKAF
jgi:DNA-binding transcriptional ArsR family regulator